MGTVPYTTNEQEFKAKAQELSDWIKILEDEFDVRVPARVIPQMTIRYCYGICTKLDVRRWVAVEALQDAFDRDNTNGEEGIDG